MMMRSLLVTVALPIPWPAFELPAALQSGATCLVEAAEPGWAWSETSPPLGLRSIHRERGDEATGWGVDHVVLLVPDLTAATTALREVGHLPRLSMEVGGRPAAFFRVGPVLEVIESPVRAPALFGVALATSESLEVVSLRWRGLGHEVSEVRPAIQPGRRIFSVRSASAGLAVMSPDTSARSRR